VGAFHVMIRVVVVDDDFRIARLSIAGLVEQVDGFE